MNMRRLPFVMLLTVSAVAVACSDPPPAENPPQPTGTATAEPAPTTVETAAPTTTAATTAAPTATAQVDTPPAKPGKEKIVGAWQFSFEGELRAKTEADLKKKFEKEKDTKKYDAEIKKIEDAAAKEWVEFKDGFYISHADDKGKDKVVLKVKYDVVKDDAGSVTVKPNGKPETGTLPADMKDKEMTIKFKDDNTIEMPDPKKGNLIFKRKTS